MGAAASISNQVTEQELTRLTQEKFLELDTDKSGFLETNELLAVVDFVLEKYGNQLGADAEHIKVNIIQRFDKNTDGKLDCEEFKVLFREMIDRNMLMRKAKDKFEEFDTNKCGVIESGKIRQVVDYCMSAYPMENVDSFTKDLIASIDINKGGQLSLGEFINLFEQMLVRLELVKKAKVKFLELDLDKSGFLEAAEIDNLLGWVLSLYVEKTPKEQAAFRKTLLARVDANGDGKLSEVEFTGMFKEIIDRAELIAHAKEKFTRLDTNKNGFLDRSELRSVVREWINSFSSDYMGGGEEGGSDALMEIFMERIDLNRDGQIDLLEFCETFDSVVTYYVPNNIKSSLTEAVIASKLSSEGGSNALTVAELPTVLEGPPTE